MMTSFELHPQLFLKEEEIRRGMEILFYAHKGLAAACDPLLEQHQLGRAHRRALYFISQTPGLTVGDLLLRLSITKQSLSRVLKELITQGLVTQTKSNADGRQRLLHLTHTGEDLERQFFEAQKGQMIKAYKAAGAEAVHGYWQVLMNMLTPDEKSLLR